MFIIYCFTATPVTCAMLAHTSSCYVPSCFFTNACVCASNYDRFSIESRLTPTLPTTEVSPQNQRTNSWKNVMYMGF